jgi:DNA-binding NarL/FixJ family response regulator
VSTEVVIVDDQELMRLSFRLVIDSQPDLRVTGEAADGRAAVALAATLRPHVMLVDVRMPELDGVAATAQIMEADPDARIVLVTTFDLDDYLEAGRRAGAAGFLLKDAAPAQLLAAIRTVAAGGTAFPAATGTRLTTH